MPWTDDREKENALPGQCIAFFLEEHTHQQSDIRKGYTLSLNENLEMQKMREEVNALHSISEWKQFQLMF